MERAILSAEMTSIDIRGAVPRGVGAQGIELSETVRRMEESIPEMIVLLEAAVERCISLTGGSEADELVLALDDVMLQYISNLQETLKSLRIICGLDSDALKKDAGLEKKEVQRLVDVSEEEAQKDEAEIQVGRSRWIVDLMTCVGTYISSDALVCLWRDVNLPWCHGPPSVERLACTSVGHFSWF
uniref:Conserved oligomeric Golgi complex subunit 7 n=1 Tax=Zea mays TaxID=4577 RepID=B4FCN8_MAIZE|nr:unknown [Zea mays]